MCKKFEHVTPLDYWTDCAGLKHFQDKDLPPILRMHGVNDDSMEGCVRCIMILLRQAIVNSVESQIQARDASCRCVELFVENKRLKELVLDLRCYTQDWDWKYGDEWDEEMKELGISGVAQKESE